MVILCKCIFCNISILGLLHVLKLVNIHSLPLSYFEFNELCRIIRVIYFISHKID